jgi:hypothetical protein
MKRSRAAGVKPGTPKFQRAKEEMILTRLDARPKKVAPAPEPLPPPPPMSGFVRGSGMRQARSSKASLKTNCPVDRRAECPRNDFTDWLGLRTMLPTSGAALGFIDLAGYRTEWRLSCSYSLQ